MAEEGFEPELPILAAGGLPVRDWEGRLQVLLVHRRRYDDWSFPKGHLEPAEAPAAAAARELAEETGLRMRLGPPLPALAYPLPSGGTKLVRYWVAEPVEPSGAPIDADEVDRTRWCEPAHALAALSYAGERSLLAELPRLRPAGTASRAVIVVRHARAGDRGDWAGPDEQRPLDGHGHRQARQLVGLLAAFRPSRVVSSDARRARQTVAPLAASLDLEVEADPRLRELAEPATMRTVVQAVRTQVADAGGVAVLCTHRKALPQVCAALDLPPLQLAKGAVAVAHLSSDGGLLALELHDASC